MLAKRAWSVAAQEQRQGGTTARRLVEECLRRIETADGQVRAWKVIDAERALAQADRLTQEGEAGRWRSPVHGMPVGIKDIIDVFDLPTSCGSCLWNQSYARQDAPIVRRLRQAGAVILGKTVTTPYAYLDPPPTRNPWRYDRTPGGSSSGSAAAVAAGMAWGALGSQTGGSVVRPAAYCGVCGFKPTYGRLPTQGVLPLAPSLDHVGLFALTVSDLLALFTVVRSTPPEAYQPLPLDNPVLISLPEYLEDPRLEPVMYQAFQQWRKVVADQGWTWLETSLPLPLAEIRHCHGVILAVEAAAYHEERLQRRPEDYPARMTELVRQGLSVSGVAYQQSRQHQRAARRRIDEWLMHAGGMLVVPAASGPAPSADTTGDPAFQSPWSYLGLPVVTFPIAWTAEGLPLGVQLVGPRHSDEALLSLAERLSAIVSCAV